MIKTILFKYQMGEIRQREREIILVLSVSIYNVFHITFTV